MLSVVSRAVKVSASALVQATVNVATPELSVVPWTVVMVGEPEPVALARETALPETGLP